MNRLTGNYLICGLALSWIMGLTGCATFKNPVSTEPPVFTEAELAEKIPNTVTIAEPTIHNFAQLEDDWAKKYALESALREAKRLVGILTQCQIFDSVRLAKTDEAHGDFHLEALRRNVERTSTDDPWLLLYGGIIPVHSKVERGIRFQFIKGDSGEFNFTWVEETVIGFWAPVVDGSSKWKSNRDGSTYWSDLRAALYERFTETDRS